MITQISECEETTAESLSYKLMCETCGRWRVESSSGLVCPDGHGRVIVCDERQRYKANVVRWRRGIPPAVQISPQRWRVGSAVCQISDYNLVMKSYSARKRVPDLGSVPGGHVLAKLPDGRIRCLKVV